jgi:heme-degrading monooxygenase HmoA
MIAATVGVRLADGQRAVHLGIAADPRPPFDGTDGFVSRERFAGPPDSGKLPPPSLWRGEEAVAVWRRRDGHRPTPARGRDGEFRNHRRRVAGALRAYEMAAGAPGNADPPTCPDR